MTKNEIIVFEFWVNANSPFLSAASKLETIQKVHFFSNFLLLRSSFCILLNRFKISAPKTSGN